MKSLKEIAKTMDKIVVMYDDKSDPTNPGWFARRTTPDGEQTDVILDTTDKREGLKAVEEASKHFNVPAREIVLFIS